MDFLKNAYYRTFQAIFNVGARALPWRKAIRVEGAGSIRHIPRILRLRQAFKPLVVTDKGLVDAGIVPRILEILDHAGVPYSLYNAVLPNPDVDTVNAIQQQYFRDGCDSFIPIGGGSPIDAAKAAAARVVKPNRTVNQLGGLLTVRRRIPLMIAVPTTAGTGSETTIAALITDPETHHKYAIMDISLIPMYAVLDPELTVGLPPHLTATTGMDALTHAVEAYLCWTYGTTESIGFAKDAVALIMKNLEEVYQNGDNIKARGNMLLGAYKAGFAFTRAGVGNVHAVAHTLGGLYDTPHGHANAVILPVVLRDYGSAVHQKLAELARLSDVSDSADDAVAANAFIEKIEAMNARMGIDDKFDFIKDEDIPQMIKWAKAETNPLYPVPVIYNDARYEAIIQAIRK